MSEIQDHVTAGPLHAFSLGPHQVAEGKTVSTLVPPDLEDIVIHRPRFPVIRIIGNHVKGGIILPPDLRSNLPDASVKTCLRVVCPVARKLERGGNKVIIFNGVYAEGISRLEGCVACLCTRERRYKMHLCIILPGILLLGTSRKCCERQRTGYNGSKSVHSSRII